MNARLPDERFCTRGCADFWRRKEREGSEKQMGEGMPGCLMTDRVQVPAFVVLSGFQIARDEEELARVPAFVLWVH